MTDDFYYQNSCGLTLVKSKVLDQYPEITHAFSTRGGGVSTGECDSLNLSWKRRDSEENVKENHRRLAQAMGILPENYAFVQLTHSDSVIVLNETHRNNGRWWKEIPVGYDASITNCRNVALMARTADCNTVLLYDPVQKAIGAVHGGWKGTLNGVAYNAVKAMEQAYGCKSESIIAAVGPSICGECFLVHEDVAGQFQERYGCGVYDRAVQDGRFSVDLWQCTLDHLARAGIAQEHMTIARECTCCNAEMFFSHRRQKGKTGIMLAVIQLL
ncbi:MAG: peptidoglycan editing factor PgeF [Clostridiales bacterium]|nr:peptidoglycan editing factor PgeF [Clostridiales bacterium]